MGRARVNRAGRKPVRAGRSVLRNRPSWNTAGVCRLSHFEYVKSDDLERIGMGRPAIRRLMDAVKKHKNKKKRGLFDKVTRRLPLRGAGARRFRTVLRRTMHKLCRVHRLFPRSADSTANKRDALYESSCVRPLIPVFIAIHSSVLPRFSKG